MKNVKSIVWASMVLGLCACGNRSAAIEDSSISALNADFKNMDKAAAVAEIEQSTVKTADEWTERKLIKNGEMSFETRSIPETKAFLQKNVAAGGGYICNERIESYSTNPTEVLTIRIPSNAFDSLIHHIERYAGEVDVKRIDINDVTAEFVDIEARLKNKKQLEETYRDLLKKANDMDAILQIEGEISRIREEIDATEGRLRYLNSQVNYSTLSLTYYEERPAAGFKFGQKMGDAVSKGGTGFLWFMIGLVELWPLWIAVMAFFFVIRLVIRRYKKKRLLKEKNRL